VLFVQVVGKYGQFLAPLLSLPQFHNAYSLTKCRVWALPYSQNIHEALTYSQIAEVFLFISNLKGLERELLIYTDVEAKCHPGTGPSTNIKPKIFRKN